MLRMWEERSENYGKGAHWRFQVEDPHTGRRHGFDDLNLHRIYVSILQSNLGSIRTCEKAGFRHEGTIREGAYKNGRYHDLVLMGLLKSELPKEDGDR